MKGKRNTSKWSLLRYFDEIYVPAKLDSGALSDSSASRMRYNIEKFDRFNGWQTLCDEITSDLLRKFSAWLVDQGIRQATTATYVNAIKSVLRHRNPERFPRLRYELPKFVESDVQGTLDEIVRHRYLPERVSIASDYTIKHYARALRLFGEAMGHTPTPADLTDEKLGKFLRWLVEVQRVKAVTANGYAKQIKALWNWMAKKHMVAQFPTIEGLRQPRQVPVAWTESEVQAIVAACVLQQGYIGPLHARDFWLAFQGVQWDSGERTGAMLALKWSWLDFDTGHLSVPGEFRKGGQKPGLYPLKEDTLEILHVIEKPERDLIFEIGARQNGGFYRRYRALIKSAGLRYVKGKCGPQKMRRTFASYIAAAGGNATRALMHSDSRTTEESYLDPRIADVEHENAKLFRLRAATA
jgi:integrase